MRNDEEQDLAPDPTPDPNRPATARFGTRGVVAVVLALLTAATCWAVAVLASAWLVPPYLLLMALILFAPSGRPRDASGPAASTSANSLDSARRAEGIADPSMPSGPSSESASADPATGGNPDQATTPAPAKGKRGRGRPRKIKPTPVEASWVQVGPGKFVRVEASETAAQAGPHEAVGVPVEVTADTPQPLSADGEGQRCPDPADTPATATEADNLATDPGLEPAEDAEPGFDPVEARDDAPAGVALPEPPSAILGEDDAPTGSEDGWDDVPAADGIAPQAEDAFPDAPETEWAEPSADEGPGRDRDDSMDEDSEETDAPLADRFLPHLPGQDEGHPDDGAAMPLSTEYDPESEYEGEAETPVPSSDLVADASETWYEDDAAEDADADDAWVSDDSSPAFVPEPPLPAMPDVPAIGFVSSHEEPEPSHDGFVPTEDPTDLSHDGFVSSEDLTDSSQDGFVSSDDAMGPTHDGFVLSEDMSDLPEDGLSPSCDGFVSSEVEPDLSHDGFVSAEDGFDPETASDLASAVEDIDPPAADFASDPPAPGAVPDAPVGSFGWISRLAPRSRTRDVAGRPAIGNATPSRRHDRSRRPSPRRPLESRPPSRRGLGRARQIIRTTPPRSPPRNRWSVGG